MDYKVTIDKFAGPLDLLLHLIKQEDINIFDVKIADITNQYLSYINHMGNLDLNIDSEYIIMAANLIEMKARELLPKEEVELEEEDPREELINRLVEYQKYKELTDTFKDLESERSQYYSKCQSFLEEYQDKSLKIGADVSLDDLVRAFAKFQERKFYERPMNTVVTKKEYSLRLRNSEILTMLKKSKKLDFEDLFDTYDKGYVVITFLSILELVKKQQIDVKQDYNLGNITLLVKGENV